MLITLRADSQEFRMCMVDGSEVMASAPLEIRYYKKLRTYMAALMPEGYKGPPAMKEPYMAMFLEAMGHFTQRQLCEAILCRALLAANPD